MKAVILAGGFGTRISEESAVRPKPMVAIGPQPIIWHIMKLYAHHGITDFIIACGYKGEVIKNYFSEMFLSSADVTFDLQSNGVQILHHEAEPWTVTCVNTGIGSMTGGRMRRVRKYLGDETFCMTYGDGVSNVDIKECIRYHREQGKLGTLTATKPPGRFGAFSLHPTDRLVRNFVEKKQDEGAWVNGGFFVLEPEVIDYIPSDDEPWEKSPLENLAQAGQIAAYRHLGFWQPMDTLRDKHVLENLWHSGNAPWKVWD